VVWGLGGVYLDRAEQSRIGPGGTGDERVRK